MIFKTINSSVDETRKTLALFNKDWNTYKRNWQNANGVFGKIGSVFTPANAIIKSDIEAIKAYNSQIDSCVTSQTAFNRTMLNASPAAQNLVASYNGGKVSAQGMATAQNAAKASTIGLTIAQTALNAAIGMGIGLLISLVVKGIDKLVHANEEAIEKAEELRRKYEEFKSTNESNITTLNGLKKEFEELSKGVSQYGDNISLTTEQYERYKEIIQQIVGMSPSLAEGYSTENGYIADKNGLLERAIELQEQEYRNELRKITNLDNLKTSMSGYIAKYKEAFNGGLVTDDMSATATREFTDLKNAIYEIFNTNNRSDFSSEDMIRQIMSSISIEDIEAEMAKYYNKYGYFQDQNFWNDYADVIAQNIQAITNFLNADVVGLDDTVFDQNTEKVDSAAQSYLDMKDAISMANESIQRDLGYIAEYADGYSNLSTEQQKFVNEFLKGYDISDIMSESNNPFDQGWKFDEDKMASVKSQITKFVEALSQDETTKTALADLYAIPTDEQSISEFIEQFRNALEVIKAYCQENGIEIPIAITDSEQTINNLEAQYQRAVDFAKDKFDGYDPTAFFKEHSINTQEEIDKWQKIAQGARDAAEAEKEYLNQGRETEIFSSFSGTEIGERLQYITSQFKEGEISCKEYFDALNSEIANVDFSNYTSSLEKANAASQQFFVDSTQQVASGLSDLINKFDSGSISVSEYLDGYLSIANTLSTLTDELQENSASWNQNGNAMSDATSGMLDNTQSALDDAISTIQSYQDSIYSLEQILTGAVEAGTDEFSAHTQVIAEDLANIVATGGQMADEIANTLGTTTSEIASSMSENVSNQSLAAQVIAANTNTAIGDMAVSIGQLFDTLGNAISNFKVDLTFGISDFNLKDVALGILGVQELPEIKFSLQASGESLSTIGSAISSFGKSVASNLAPQMIEMPDFNFNGEDKYTPDAGVLDNYNKKLDNLKDAQKGAGNATKDTTDDLKEQKEALQEQKEAAEEALQAQIDGIDDVIKGKEKEIALLDDEIDKIKEASEARKRDIELQKAQYDLERMQNQRPTLVYSEEKGMHYVPDTKGIRDAREKVTEIQEDIEIANLEKKKDLIQDEIDALEEQKDLIKDMIEESNKYYDNLIKNIEKSITELNKSADNAGKAASNVGSSIGNLKKTLDTGKTLSYYIWTVQDEEVLANAKAGLENLNALLEKNPENYHYAQLKDDAASFVSELEKLKETRLVTDDFTNSLNILKNSEDEYLRLFQDALTGVEERVNNTANYSEKILGFVSPIADKTGELKQTLEKTNEDVANLGSNTGDVVNGISTSVDGTNENINRMTGSVADAVMQVSRDSGLLNGSVTGISDTVTRVTESTSAGFNNLADNMSNTASSISQNADTVNNALDSISDSERFHNLAGSFGSLGEAILGVSNALGISEEGTVGGLVSAITAISEISLGGEEGGIIGQFHNLKTAIDEVSASIAGGGSEGTTSGGKSDSSGSANGGKGNKGAGSNSGSASSVTGSLEQLLQAADETLGSNGEEGEGGEGVIGKFGLLKTAVDLVTSAIGAGEEGSETEGSTLIGALMSQYATAEELIPQEKSLFEELLSSIEACVNALNGMKEAMSGMPGMGGISVSPHASGTVGNAFAKGYNGLPHDEKNALVSEYGQQEMTLLPNGKTILTDKPTMMDLPKDTVIFNEEQTKKIMDNKVDLSGNAYADGTDDGIWTTLPDGTKVRPLQPGDKMYDMVQKFDAYFKSIDGNLEKLVPSSYYEHNRQMEEMTKQINYVSSITNNNRNMQPVISIGDVNVTCPGVTSQEVMREVGDALGKQIGHLSQRALQEAYKR